MKKKEINHTLSQVIRIDDFERGPLRALKSNIKLSKSFTNYSFQFPKKTIKNDTILQ